MDKHTYMEVFCVEVDKYQTYHTDTDMNRIFWPAKTINKLLMKSPRFEKGSCFGVCPATYNQPAEHCIEKNWGATECLDGKSQAHSTNGMIITPWA